MSNLVVADMFSPSMRGVERDLALVCALLEGIDRNVLEIRDPVSAGVSRAVCDALALLEPLIGGAR